MNHNRFRQASFALNIGLLTTAVFLAMSGEKPDARHPNPTGRSSHLESLRPTQPAPEHPVASYTATAPPSDQRRWLVDQLRGMGVPTPVLARIVMANIDSEWTKRAAELSIKCHGDPDTMAALQLKVDQSMDAEMRSALGEEGFREWDRANMMREANPGSVALTPDETETTYVTWKKLQTRELALKEARVNRTMDEADIADAYGQAVSEFNLELKSSLGDERYAKLQQTDTKTVADSLRREMAAAEPSEAQLQELLKAQQRLSEGRSALDQEFQGTASSSLYADKIKQLTAARDSEYERILGPGTFDALQKTQDPGYAQMKKNQALWGLDDDSVENVYATMKLYAKTVQAYNAETKTREANGQQVNWEAANNSLEKFKSDTQASLRNSLGQERFDTLTRNNVFRFNEIGSP